MTWETANLHRFAPLRKGLYLLLDALEPLPLRPEHLE